MKLVLYPSFLSLFFAIFVYYTERILWDYSRYPCKCTRSSPGTKLLSWDTSRRDEIAELVSKRYPWASINDVPNESEYYIAKDERTAGCSRKRYFTVGYDTNDDKRSPIPGKFDFFVRFNNTKLWTSPYYFKPSVILSALKGCKTNVNFIYKDTDVVLKKDIQYAFRDRRISYQEEMYNDSANAGIILGKNTAKVKDLLLLWNAGVGIAGNIEQDQTILRSLVSEYPASFERLSKNSVGTHVYSSAKNRQWNIAKFKAKQWDIFRILYNALSFYAIYLTIRAVASNKFMKIGQVVSHQRNRNRNYLGSRLSKYLNDFDIFFLVHLGLLIKLLLGNPLFVAKSIGKRTRNDAYRYHLGDHFLADDLTRIHCGGATIFMSDTRTSYEIYNLFGISEALIIVAADALYLAMEFLPFSVFAICMWFIFLSAKYTKSAESIQ